MKEITLSSQQALFDQIASLVSEHGMIVIGSSNQNRTSWASFEALSVLREKHSNGTPIKIVTMGELDQYSDVGFHVARLEDIESGMIVYGGAIRSPEKANLLLKAAKICPVVAIVHASKPVTRFRDMGCDMTEVEDNLKAVFIFENDLT